MCEYPGRYHRHNLKIFSTRDVIVYDGEDITKTVDNFIFKKSNDLSASLQLCYKLAEFIDKTKYSSLNEIVKNTPIGISAKHPLKRTIPISFLL